MTPAERIRKTLRREAADRPPVDFWATPEVMADLHRHFGTTDPFDLYRAMGVDKIVWASPAHHSSDPKQSQWGVRHEAVQAGQALYHEVSSRPLAAMEEAAELADFTAWPDPETFDYASAQAALEAARRAGFATVGPWISVFEVYCGMRGLEQALMDLVLAPDFVEAALERIFTIQTAMLERYLAAAGDLLDMVFISDDLGSQESLLISLPLYDRFLRDRHRAWCEIIRRHGRAAMFHTDGAVRPLIPRLIEIGVEVLNPIQHVCPGMEREALKRDFGEALVFYGGVENQRVLPFGSAAEVRAETLECRRTLGAGGGFICCSCHNIQAGTPVANVLAMVAACRGE